MKSWDGGVPYRLLKIELGTFLPLVESTNDILDESKPPGTWIIAEEQTKGRGRRNKDWISLGKGSLFFSGKVMIPTEQVSVTLLSMFLAASVARACIARVPELSNELQVKWPNDLYRNGKKVAGILIESKVLDGNAELILGIGLNLYTEQMPTVLEDFATYLFDSTFSWEQKIEFSKSLVKEINQTIIVLTDGGQVLKELSWLESVSFYKNKVLEWEQNGETQRAGFIGYDEMGRLILKKETGEKIEMLDSPADLKVL